MEAYLCTRIPFFPAVMFVFADKQFMTRERLNVLTANDPMVDSSLVAMNQEHDQVFTICANLKIAVEFRYVLDAHLEMLNN